MRTIDVPLFSIVWCLFGFIYGVNTTAKLIELDTTDVSYTKVEQQYAEGIASWYDYNLDGIEWSKTHDTCASRTAERYSTLIVENIENGKKIECFVNDYGPEEITGREIDISSHAFAQLAPLSRGLINVRIINK